MSAPAGLGRGCFVRPLGARQCVDTSTRTNSLTRREPRNQEIATFSELCPNWDKSDMIC